MQIRFVRHATLVIQMKETRILVDPMLSAAGDMPPIANSTNDRRNPLIDLPISIAELLQVDAVLLTHLHRDHFDQTAADVIAKGTQIFCQPGDESKLQELGFRQVTPVVDALEWRGCRIVRTEGRHGTGEIGEKMGPVSGFVLRAESEPRVYLAGDTIYCNEVKQALHLHEPDIVIINAGAAQFAYGSPITMTAQDVLSVCEATRARHILAVHMEAINHCLLSRDQLRQSVQGGGCKDRVMIPADGEVILF